MTTDLLSQLDERVSRARQLLLPRGSVDFALPPGPDLLSYHHYVISISGGKDSQASLDVLAHLLYEARILHHVTTVHADMGRADWLGTAALAREHALRAAHEVMARAGCDLLDRVAERGKWPDRGRRWCTSDFKRGPIRRITMLVAESRVTMSTTAADGIAAERIWPVPHLSTPDEEHLANWSSGREYEAIALFRKRAEAADVSVGQSEAVSQLCQRLDGLPLAIELAVTWLRTLTVDEFFAMSPQQRASASDAAHGRGLVL
ncbi:hypothetical protein ACIHDR_48550 [Nocardia sp. NPDC052278]|uniref:hypothetical protein n=1 Tax=unclassified Nocardia TaxID=2637762 RepID=UPI0036C2EA87